MDLTQDVTVVGLYNAAVAASGGKLKRSRLEPLVAALVPQLAQKDRRKIVNIVSEEEDGSISLPAIKLLLERCSSQGNTKSTPISSVVPSPVMTYHCVPDPLIQQEREIFAGNPISEFASQTAASRSPIIMLDDCAGTVNQLLSENAELRRLAGAGQQDPNRLQSILSENENLRRRLDSDQNFNNFDRDTEVLIQENQNLRRHMANTPNSTILLAENDDLRRQLDINTRGSDTNNQLAYQQNTELRRQVAQSQEYQNVTLRENGELKVQNARLREQLQEATTQISTLSAEAVYKSQARIQSLNLLQQPQTEGLEERLAELEHELAEARAGKLHSQGMLSYPFFTILNNNNNNKQQQGCMRSWNT